jgi:hypothetical protein
MSLPCPETLTKFIFTMFRYDHGRLKQGLLLLLFAWGSFSLVQAQSESWTQVLDEEKSWVHQVPSWIAPLSPEKGAGHVSTLSYEFLPSPGKFGILMSLVFQEKEGGFLRVSWESGEGSATLSENLYEGTAGLNRRYLAISQELLDRGGILTIQVGGKDHGVRKIRWDWLQPSTVLTVEDHEIGCLGPQSLPLSVSEITSDPAPFPEDLWRDRMVTAQVTERVERIELGVEFPVQLEQKPDSARLEVLLNGLDLKESMLLWINDRHVAWLYPEIPDFSDLAYVQDAQKGLIYGGWRKAVAYLPLGTLVEGENRIHLSREKEEAEPAPLAIKDLKLQLTFP